MYLQISIPINLSKTTINICSLKCEDDREQIVAEHHTSLLKTVFLSASTAPSRSVSVFLHLSTILCFSLSLSLTWESISWDTSQAVIPVSVADAGLAGDVAAELELTITLLNHLYYFCSVTPSTAKILTAIPPEKIEELLSIVEQKCILDAVQRLNPLDLSGRSSLGGRPGGVVSHGTVCMYYKVGDLVII